MKTKTKVNHKISAIVPRLSDEDIDPIEQDETDNLSTLAVEGWLPWDQEDIDDIMKLIEYKLPPKSRFVLLSFLDGKSYTEIDVTEKYWRYHFSRGIELIKQELKL